MHYTLTFKPGTETAITGSKADLVAELRNLIDEIEALQDDEPDVFRSVPMYDMDGSDYITATIES